MTKEDRQRIVLEFMAEHTLALPPKYVYRNLKYKRGIPFSERTVKRALNALVEDGLLEKVDPSELDEGRVQPADDGTRGAYIITDQGRERLEDPGE